MIGKQILFVIAIFKEFSEKGLIFQRRCGRRNQIFGPSSRITSIKRYGLRCAIKTGLL